MTSTMHFVSFQGRTELIVFDLMSLWEDHAFRTQNQKVEALIGRRTRLQGEDEELRWLLTVPPVSLALKEAAKGFLSQAQFLKSRRWEG